MARTITELGPREAEFLATMAGNGDSVFTFERASGFWGGGQYARNALAQLEDKGWIERLERGRYLLIPLEAGLEREWSEDPLAIGSFLVPDGAAAYWTAVRHWGWTTQLPSEQIFITPRRRYQPRSTVLGVRYRFVTLKPERIFGITEEWQRGLVLKVTDRERTVVDMMDRPDLAGGIAEVSESLRMAWQELELSRVTEYMSRLGSGTVPKRFGFLAEQMELPEFAAWLPRWRELIGSGFTQLERGGAPGGRMLRRWNLQVNAAGFDTPQQAADDS